jgi:hypothetical protein
MPWAATADVEHRTVHDGSLVMEDVPEIPDDVVVDLMRFQNIRAAGFRAWTADGAGIYVRAWTDDGAGIYVSTGFGDVDSIHRVDMPGGARHQLTFYREPVSEVTRRPGGSQLLFTRDAGGSEPVERRSENADRRRVPEYRRRLGPRRPAHCLPEHAAQWRGERCLGYGPL